MKAEAKGKSDNLCLPKIFFSLYIFFKQTKTFLHSHFISVSSTMLLLIGALQEFLLFNFTLVFIVWLSVTYISLCLLMFNLFRFTISRCFKDFLLILIAQLHWWLLHVLDDLYRECKVLVFWKPSCNFTYLHVEPLQLWTCCTVLPLAV